MKHSVTCIAFAASLVATGASAEIVGETFEYTVGDTVFEGYAARNTNLEQTRGTVMIVHDWDGMTAYEERRADMLAALGYTAVAIDVYGRDTDPQSVDEYRQLSGALYQDRDLFRERLLGSLDAISDVEGSTDDVVVIGYCFGGAAVLEMARAGADVEGYVSFHGGLGTPEGQDYAATQAPVLLLHGSADPVSGMSDLATLIDQLQSNGVEHAARVFGGARHAFTVWDSQDYDARADRGSWNALQGFLQENLGS
ncbi:MULTISPECIES: dienelactone hydrolase family protein [unclassified Roseitalea]|uniref:dienelactone hydrolase family protein n=1 Tax=unclassified Roseitalea TaxID=2639107 RepID=UPI00273D216A|nr:MULTISPECIES: dienelactone hydrolase family protein [unclassified Roseitalea]